MFSNFQMQFALAITSFGLIFFGPLGTVEILANKIDILFLSEHETQRKKKYLESLVLKIQN